MTGTGTEQPTSTLGVVAAIRRSDEAIMYLDVAFDVEAIQAGWPEFESRFTSLRGRTMMAVVFPEQGIYRLATQMRGEDDPDSLGLRMGVVPGGSYLMLSLAGEAPGVHRGIGPAFDELHGLGEYDASRPCLEAYRSSTEIDCLLPILG